MKTKIWLNTEEIKEIKEILFLFKNIKKVVIFWSRAKWNYKRWSDIDLAILLNNKNDNIWKISDKLNNETLLPYKFDIKNYNTISNKDLKNHIDRVWIEI